MRNYVRWLKRRYCSVYVECVYVYCTTGRSLPMRALGPRCGAPSLLWYSAAAVAAAVSPLYSVWRVQSPSEVGGVECYTD